MEKITYNNQKGVFFPDMEFEELKDKIVAQRQMINELEKELGI